MPDGRLRDSAWYAVVDQDWPDVRERLQARVRERDDGDAGRAGHEEGRTR
jgi:hypothetical protein